MIRLQQIIAHIHRPIRRHAEARADAGRRVEGEQVVVVGRKYVHLFVAVLVIPQPIIRSHGDALRAAVIHVTAVRAQKPLRHEALRRPRPVVDVQSQEPNQLSAVYTR